MSLITGQNSGQGDGSSTTPGNQPDWRSSLPDDLKNEKVFESIKGKDWNEAGPVLAKNYINAQRLVGADKIVLPTDKSTPEQIAEFRTKIGVPAKPEEYGYKLPEGLTEDKLDKSRMDTWKKRFHEAGIPKSKGEQLISDYLADEFGSLSSQQSAAEKQREQYELTIKQEFGTKFDEKINFARFALTTYGTPGLTEMLESTGMGSHPDVVRFFSKIGEQLSDDKARGGSGGGNSRPNTPAAAQDALNAFNRDQAKQKALFDRNDPNHDAVVKERTELFQQAFPSDKK